MCGRARTPSFVASGDSRWDEVAHSLRAHSRSCMKSESHQHIGTVHLSEIVRKQCNICRNYVYAIVETSDWSKLKDSYLKDSADTHANADNSEACKASERPWRAGLPANSVRDNGYVLLTRPKHCPWGTKTFEWLSKHGVVGCQACVMEAVTYVRVRDLSLVSRDCMRGEVFRNEGG